MTAVSLASPLLGVLSPWFLLFLAPLAVFGYITTILALTVYRFAPRGGDFQQMIHDLMVAKAGPPAGGRALYVGCGSGSLVVKLAKASPDSTVTGIDSWARNWEYSKAQCEENAAIEIVEALRVLGPGGRYAFLDLFDEPACYQSQEHVRAAVSRAGASIAEFTNLADLMPLPYPLRHPKVLGHAMLLSGAKPAEGMMER